MKAVALLSGGMDSTTLVYSLRSQGFEDIHCLSINYGQRHVKELDYAKRICHKLSMRHDIVDMSGITRLISSSALTGDTEVPEGHYAEDNMAQTVVPNRNMMMLSIAAAVAVTELREYVACAVHAGDHAVYPDCRPEFIEAMTSAIMIGNEGFGLLGFPPLLTAPFLLKSKADIAYLGDRLHVPWEMTWSCYKGEHLHCGRCGTCVERQEAFALADVTDPTQYADPDFWKETVAHGG